MCRQANTMSELFFLSVLFNCYIIYFSSLRDVST
jgi:hypothetical protein